MSQRTFLTDTARRAAEVDRPLSMDQKRTAGEERVRYLAEVKARRPLTTAELIQQTEKNIRSIEAKVTLEDQDDTFKVSYLYNNWIGQLETLSALRLKLAVEAEDKAPAKAETKDPIVSSVEKVVTTATTPALTALTTALIPKSAAIVKKQTQLEMLLPESDLYFLQDSRRSLEDLKKSLAVLRAHPDVIAATEEQLEIMKVVRNRKVVRSRNAIGSALTPLSSEQQGLRELFEKGVDHERGLGVVRDEQKAAEYFFLAARGGYAPAKYKLAFFCETGRGEVDICERLSDAPVVAGSDPYSQRRLANSAILFHEAVESTSPTPTSVKEFFQIKSFRQATRFHLAWGQGRIDFPKLMKGPSGEVKGEEAAVLPSKAKAEDEKRSSKVAQPDQPPGGESKGETEVLKLSELAKKAEMENYLLNLRHRLVTKKWQLKYKRGENYNGHKLSKIAYGIVLDIDRGLLAGREISFWDVLSLFQKIKESIDQAVPTDDLPGFFASRTVDTFLMYKKIQTEMAELDLLMSAKNIPLRTFR